MAYLLGAFPTAYMMGKMARGIDIRLVGSRNPGALNAYRQLGWFYGLVVLLFDAGKGALSVYVGKWLGAPDTAIYIAAVLALMGHNWSVFQRFKGGKGAAVVFGLSLAIMPLLTSLVIPILLLALVFTRNAVTSMAIAFAALNVLIIATFQPLPLILLCLALTTIVAVTHFVRPGPRLAPAIRDRAWREVARIE